MDSNKPTNQPIFGLPKPPINKPIQFPKFIKRLVPVCLTLLVFLGIFGYFSLNKNQVNEEKQIVSNKPSNQKTSQALKVEEPIIPSLDSKVLPSETENIYKLSINIDSTASGKIKGSFNFKNSTPNNLTDLHYIITLNTQATNKAATVVNKEPPPFIQPTIISRLQSDAFELRPSQQKDFQFEIDFPTTIPSGEYDLELNIIAKSGSILYTSYKPLSLNGSNTLLAVNIHDCKMIAEGKDYNDTIIAPPLNPNDTPITRCKVTNPTNSQKTFKPVISYATQYAMLSPNPKTEFKTDQTFTLKPRETKEIDINLPALATPQVYEAIAQLQDTTTGKVDSAYLTLRWTVRGASANISQSTLDKDYYLKGEHASINLVAAPSLDLWWRDNPVSGKNPNEGTVLKEPKVQITLTSNGKLCGQTEQNLTPRLTLDPWQEIIKVKINSDCFDPKIESKILDGSSVLASFDQQFKTSDQNIKEPETKQKHLLSQWIKIGGVIVLFLLLLVIGWFISKKFKKSPPTPIQSGPTGGPTRGPTPPNLKTILILLLSLSTAAFILHNPLNISALSPAGNVGPTGPAGDSGNNGFYFWYTSPSDTAGQGLDVSKVRSVSEDTLEVTISGKIFNYNCGNSGVEPYIINYIDNSDTNVEVIDPFVFNTRRYGLYSTNGVTNNAFNLQYHNGGPDVTYQIIYQVRKVGGFGGGPHVLNIEFKNRIIYASTNGTQFTGDIGQVNTEIPGGWFDGTDNNSCSIWGWSKLNPSSQTNIEVFRGTSTNPDANAGVTSFLADTSRPDLGGNYGFAQSLTNYIGDGTQKYLWLYGVTTSGERLYTPLGNDPKAITCPRRAGPSASVSSACMQSGTTADISWGSITPGIIYVDIATDSNFSNWANKYVAGSTSTNTSGFSGGFTLQPGTTYYVRTWNGWVHSATTSFTTPGNCTPPAPTLSTPTTSCTGGVNPQIDLSWSATANTGRYRIYRNNSILTTTTGTSYTDTAILQNTNYSYYVVSESSLNSSFVSNPSNTVSITSNTCTASCTVSWPSIPIQNPNTNFTASFTQANSNVGFNYISLYKDGARQPLSCSGSNCSGTINSGTSGSHELKVKIWDLAGYGIGTDPPSAVFCTPRASYTVYDQLTASCSANPSSGVTGQTINWSSSALGGSGSYSYSWSGAASGTSASTSNSYNSTGTKTANLRVASAGQSFDTACSVNISPAQPSSPSVSLPGCINSGYNGSGINITWRNNDVPVTWVDIDTNTGNGYYHKAVPASQQAVNGWATINASDFTWYTNNSTLTFNPRSTYRIRLYNGAHSPLVYFVTPYSCLTNVFCSGSPNPQNINQPVSWSSSTPSGGSGNYSYSWSGTDSLSDSGPNISKSYTYIGNKTANLTVTSSDNQTLASGCSVAINYPPLQASCSVNPTSVTTDQPVNWSSSASGGDGLYSYTWSGTDGLTGSNATTSKSYSSIGNKTGSIRVTSNSQTVNASCSNSVSINPAQPSPPSVSMPGCMDSGYSGSGITITWLNNSVANYWIDIDTDGNWNNGFYHKSVGGSANAWANTNGTGFNGYNGPSGTLTYNPRSTYRVRTWNGAQSPDPFFVTPYTCLQVSCSGYPNPVYTNQTTDWTSIVSGGNGSNAYIWSRDANDTRQSTSYASYSTPGSKRADLTVNSSDGQTQSTSCSITVEYPPPTISCVNNPTSGTTGQNINRTFTASSGDGTNYRYSWSGTDAFNGTANTGTSHIVSKIYRTTGIKTASVSVTSGGKTTSSNCPNINISAQQPPQPTVTTPACIQANNNGSSISITWTNNDVPVTWANIDNDNDWNNGYYQKDVSGVSSTNTTGFTWYNNNNVLQFSPNTTYYVRIYNGAHSPTASFRIEQCLLVQCSVSPAAIEPNQSATWTGTSTGGNGTNRYTYTWSGTEGLAAGPTNDGPTNSVTKTYTTIGIKSATVRVQTPAQDISQTCFNQLDVNFAPFLQTKEGDVHTNTQIDSPGGPR